MKRYSVHIHSLACIAEEDGEFVKATDAAAIAAERDRMRGQRDRLVDLLRVSYMHAQYAENDYHASKIDALLEEIEKESHD